ncbi:hypothetical protein FACS189487_08240 [Campylobacterota bacterium]|nr:hypothetical protein FACS189487_08240 [Campylobacterota bacterium]
MKKISLAVAAALSAAAVMSAAGEFSAGGIGYFEFNSYDQTQGNGEDTASFLSGTVSLDYKSGALGNGLSYNLGGILNRKIWENNDGDWLSTYGPAPRPIDDTIFHTANIAWSNNLATVIAGRQEIELEWLSDYHEAVVGVLKPTKEFTITAGWTRAFTSADYDGYNDGFSEIKDLTDNDSGAFVVDAAIELGSGLTIEPWIYLVPDLTNFFGGKVAIEQDAFNASLAYTIATDESDGDADDDSFLHFTIGADVSDSLKVLAGAGLSGSKENAAGLLGQLGDNVNPFEDGNYFLENDTLTIYGGVEYASGKLTLGALGGISNTGDKGSAGKGRAIEIDLSAEYAINDVFSVKGIIVDQLGGSKAYKDEDYLSVRLAAIYNYGGK